jgi:hypothetical protein
MGEAKRRRTHFLKFAKVHPHCAYCGGPTETIDHCPPRAMFQGRIAPEELEFPACDACNQGTKKSDALVALMGRLDPFFASGDKDGRGAALVRTVHQFYPTLLEQMMPATSSEARRLNRSLGVTPTPGFTQKEAGVMRVPEQMHEKVGHFALKFGKAIFYRHAESVFPSAGAIAFHWFTNAELARHGHYPVFAALSELVGQSPNVKNAGRNLRDQFEYKVTVSSGKELFIVQAVFGKGFGLVVMGNIVAANLTAFLDDARAASGSALFTVLQPSVATSSSVAAG